MRKLFHSKTLKRAHLKPAVFLTAMQMNPLWEMCQTNKNTEKETFVWSKTFHTFPISYLSSCRFLQSGNKIVKVLQISKDDIVQYLDYKDSASESKSTLETKSIYNIYFILLHRQISLFYFNKKSYFIIFKQTFFLQCKKDTVIIRRF